MGPGSGVIRRLAFHGLSGDHHQPARELFGAQAVGVQELVQDLAGRASARLGLHPHGVAHDAAGEEYRQSLGLQALESRRQGQPAEGTFPGGGGRDR